MTLEHQTALAELSGVLDHIDADSLDTACLALTKERSIILYRCAREGLQMRGLAMRLYHLGLQANMLGAWQRRRQATT